jgi:hypothetical protein
MSRVLRTNVFVKGKLHKAGTAEGDLPDGVVIPNHKAWVEAETVEAQVRNEPPRVGKGSSREAWSEFASLNGFAADDEATRDQIIEALEEAEIIGS